MGHVINPISFRLGRVFFWDFVWSIYIKKHYKYLVLQDIAIYNFLVWFFNLKKVSKLGFLLGFFKILRVVKKVCLFLYLYNTETRRISLYKRRLAQKKNIYIYQVKPIFLISSVVLGLNKIYKYSLFEKKPKIVKEFINKNILLKKKKYFKNYKFAVYSRNYRVKKKARSIKKSRFFISKKYKSFRYRRIKHFFSKLFFKKHAHAFVFLRGDDEKSVEVFSVPLINVKNVLLNKNYFIFSDKVKNLRYFPKLSDVKKYNLTRLALIENLFFNKKFSFFYFLKNKFKLRALFFKVKFLKRWLYFINYIFNFWSFFYFAKILKNLIKHSLLFRYVQFNFFFYNFYKLVNNVKMLCNFGAKALTRELQDKEPIGIIMRPILRALRKAKGFKILYAGRVTRAQRAMYKWRKRGLVSLNTQYIPVEFASNLFFTQYGVCSLKMWVVRNKKNVKFLRRSEFFMFF
jgi:hypothetical protein